MSRQIELQQSSKHDRGEQYRHGGIGEIRSACAPVLGRCRPVAHTAYAQSATRRVCGGACHAGAERRSRTWAAAVDCWPKRWRATMRAVTGIDLSPTMIEVAKLHAASAQLQIDYRAAVGRAACRQRGRKVCGRLLHGAGRTRAGSATPWWRRWRACCARADRCSWRPSIAARGRSWARSSPRNICCGLVPRGTHEYARLVRPAELARAARRAGLYAARNCRRRLRSVDAARTG